MRPNRVKQLWREDQPAFGVWLSACSPFLTEHLAAVGFDWLLVDAEHSAVDLQTMVQMFQAISHGETMPLARVPWNDPVHIKRVLDSGAYGVVVPWVNSREEAQEAVSACRYPPDGRRGFGPWRAALYGGRDYVRHANAEIACIIQIETVAAVEHVDEILSVPGIDAVMIGPTDLAMDMGLPPKADHPDPRHRELCQRVLESCQTPRRGAGHLHQRSRGGGAASRRRLALPAGGLGHPVRAGSRDLCSQQGASRSRSGGVAAEETAPARLRSLAPDRSLLTTHRRSSGVRRRRGGHARSWRAAPGLPRRARLPARERHLRARAPDQSAPSAVAALRELPRAAAADLQLEVSARAGSRARARAACSARRSSGSGSESPPCARRSPGCCAPTCRRAGRSSAVCSRSFRSVCCRTGARATGVARWRRAAARWCSARWRASCGQRRAAEVAAVLPIDVGPGLLVLGQHPPVRRRAGELGRRGSAAGLADGAAGDQRGVRRGERAARWARVVVPLAIVLAAGLVAMGCHNRAVTGDAFRIPYSVHNEQYSVAPYFVLQPLRADYRSTGTRSCVATSPSSRSASPSRSGRSRVGPPPGCAALERSRAVLLGPVLTLPLLVLPWSWRLRGMRIALGGVAMLLRRGGHDHPSLPALRRSRVPAR